MLLDCVILIRTRFTVYSVSFQLELRPQLIHWSLKYQGVELPNSQGVSCWPRFVCGITFPYTGTLDGLRVLSTVAAWLLT